MDLWSAESTFYTNLVRERLRALPRGFKNSWCGASCTWLLRVSCRVAPAICFDMRE